MPHIAQVVCTLAVFIGITASLFIDDWWRTRNDLETLEKLYGEIYHNALIEEAATRAHFRANNISLRAALELRGDEPSK